MRRNDPAIWLILAIACAAALVWFRDDLWPEAPDEMPRAPQVSVAPPAGLNRTAAESLPAVPGPRGSADESAHNKPMPTSPAELQPPVVAPQPIADFAPRAQFTPLIGLLAPGQNVLLVSGEDDPISPVRPRASLIAATSDLQFRESATSLPAKSPGPSLPSGDRFEMRTRGPDGSQSQQYPAENRLMIPVAGETPPEGVKLDVQNGLVTISAHDAPLAEVLGLLAHQQGLNVISGEDIKAKVSVSLNNVPFADALDNILAIAGYTAVRKNNILLVSSVATERKVSMQSQGRIVEVFRLNYTTATDVDLVVKGLLSPSGQSFATKGAESDYRKTQELLVVEDVPWNMQRIAGTIQQMDLPPRQVLIEAHILAVTLSDDTKCGINLEALLHGNPALTLRTDGFANAAAFATPGTDQAVFFNLASNDLNLLLEALTTTANAKTLASPKVFAVNGQQAKLQIGGQIGYKLVTTTQTSTMESVNFLNTGIILTVTPIIAPNNVVMMKVKPEVSTGQIDPTTSLPDSQTTQVETSVMLPDGHGIVIGGLIQETDTDNVAKVPWLGDLWLIGKLFRHRETVRSRNEVIISLIPHIVPYQAECQGREAMEFDRSATPLLQGCLERVPRPFEASFPDPEQLPAFFSRGRATDEGTLPVPPGNIPVFEAVPPGPRADTPPYAATVVAPPPGPEPPPGPTRQLPPGIPRPPEPQR